LFRNIVLNQGAFTFSSRLSDGGEIGFIDSGIRHGPADVRGVSKISLIVAASCSTPSSTSDRTHPKASILRIRASG